jgi:PAS domain S-box-containing protein
MTHKLDEMIHLEIPLELDAVGMPLALPGALLPGMNLSRTGSPPKGTESETNADDALAQSRYQILIGQLPAATFMAWYENGRCELYLSSYIETLLGYTATEWTANPILWYQRLHPDDRDHWNEKFLRMVSLGEPFRGDYRFLARDGRIVWIHGEVKIQHDESSQPFIHGIGYDVTELKTIEESLRQVRDTDQRGDRAKSEFLSRTSHELRAPLNGIVGFAEFLIEGSRAHLTRNRKSISRISTRAVNTCSGSSTTCSIWPKSRQGK